MIQEVCGFKDSKGNFHDTRETALNADLIDEIYVHCSNEHYARHRSLYNMTCHETVEFIVNNYVFLSRLDDRS